MGLATVSWRCDVIIYSERGHCIYYYSIYNLSELGILMAF